MSDDAKPQPSRQFQLNGFVGGGLFTPDVNPSAMQVDEPLFNFGPSRGSDTVNVLDPLRILWIDIGQGNATLVIGPNNESILIDCGSVTEDSIADELVTNATEAINSYLNTKNHLDYLIISHPDKDHVNKVDKVLKGFTVGKVLCGGVNASSYSGTGKDGFGQFLRELDKTVTGSLIFGGKPYTEALDTPSEKRLVQTKTPGFDVFIVCANAPVSTGSAISEFLELKAAKPGTEANCSSVVVCIRYKDPAYDKGTHDQVLVCADATFSTEYLILKETGWAAHLQSFLLAGGHHGSADSFSPAFLKAVNPSLVHFSANMHGRFRHPTWEVVNRVLEHCPEIENTKCGPHEIVIGCTMSDKPPTQAESLIKAPTIVTTLLTTMHDQSKDGATVLAEYVRANTVDPSSPEWLQNVAFEIVYCRDKGKNSRNFFENQELPSIYHGRVLDTMLKEQVMRGDLTFTDTRDAVVYWDSNQIDYGLISSLLGANTGVYWELSLYGDGHTAPSINRS